MKNKKGFTMAEVLVTIGIIGVVAAMTLPSVINHAKMYIIKQQFKKVVSTMENSINYIYSEDNQYYKCAYVYDKIPNRGVSWRSIDRVECPLLSQHLKKVLNPIQVCYNNAFLRGCIPDFKGLDTILTEKDPESPMLTGCPVFFKDSIQKRIPVYVLRDGSILGFYGYNSFLRFPVVFIDVNGKKRPNKWGYDIFTMRILYYNNQYHFVPYSGCFTSELGGMTPEAMMYEAFGR